jgi:ribonuclease BN (tRNA processing enzyme)
MDEPALIYQDDNIRVLSVTNDHYHFATGSPEYRYSRSYAFRIEAGGRTFVYTGDTGPSTHVVKLAKGADILASEIIDMDGVRETLQRLGNIPRPVMEGLLAHMQEDHLTPAEVGKLAAEANVKEVVLTHLVPGNDGETDMSVYTRGMAQWFNGPVHVARDLDCF